MAKKFLVSIDLAGNQLLNPVVHNLASDPGVAAEGTIFYDTVANRLKYSDGSAWKPVAHTSELAGSQSLDTLTAWSTTQDLTIGDTLTFNHNATNVTLVGASGSTGTASIFNTLSTTGNLFGAATTIAVGATSGTFTLNNPTVVGSQTTVNLWNATSTTVNAFGAATALNIGGAAGTLTIGNPAIVGATTLTLFNTVSTSVTAFSAATTLNIGVGPISGATVNIGTQASSSGTKAINIGTAGTTGSITTIVIGTTAGTTPTLTLNGSLTLGSHATAGFVKTNASGVVSIDTSTYALSSSIGAGTLGAAASSAGSTNTTVETSFSAAWNANSSSNVTIKNVVGPAITNLVAAMTGAGAGILRKTAQDTYSVDTGTYALQSYVDNAVAGLSWKDEVRVASTANLAVASAVVNAAVVDGVTLTTGDRILLKDQSAPAENGIYIVAASGAASRSTDADSETDIRGASVFVTSGTTNGGKRFTCSVSGTITLGTTALPFVLFGADTTGNLVNKYAVSFGDGAATSYTITHNLGTLDVTVEVYTVSGGASVECDITHTSTTQVTLGFVTAPTSNQYRVVVHG